MSDVTTHATRDWISSAIAQIEADFNRSADTHLVRVEMPAMDGIELYLKDESSHPTGSLKHRLARSLFLYALCNGWINDHTIIVEASSGSTAVSEAYFARMLRLPFIAVMPKTTAQEKVLKIEFYGGRCHFVDRASEVYAEAARLARELEGHYMDQFTYAERATDWRANNNIAESIFEQMRREPHPIPRWIVCGAGTGGTSATIGRFIRYNRFNTQVCLADPEGSVFHRHVGNPQIQTSDVQSSLIEGIGRSRVEPSFIREIIDRAIAVPDAASIAAARVISRRLGRLCGGSTGTNIWAYAQLASEMRTLGQTGSIVSILCDHGDRYASTYFDDAWLRHSGLDIAPYERMLETFFAAGSVISN